MGRRKVPMKRIEDKVTRRVTFSKRRSGLFKKAGDLSVLCDVEVALVVFSAGGRMYDFSAGDSLARIVQRYKNQSEEEGDASIDGCETELATPIHPSLTSGHKTYSELVQLVERQLEDPYMDQLSVPDLFHLEEEFHDALVHTRSIKAQLMMKPLLELQEQEAMLHEENKVLKEKLAASMTGGNAVGTDSTPGEPRLLQLF